MSDDITKPRQDYTNQLPSLEINRLAIGGSRPVKAAGEKCLPALASMKATTTWTDDMLRPETTYGTALTPQGKINYDLYVEYAPFTGFTGQMVIGLKGLIKAKPAVPVLPTDLEYLIDDVDGSGCPLEDLADNCIADAFPSIRQLLLITAPETDGTNSKRDDEINNIREKILHYPQESIINWDITTINNKKQYTMLVLRESKDVRDGFEIKSEYQYRHLELIKGVYHQGLRDKDNNIIDELSPVMMNGKELDYLPVKVAHTGTGSKSVIDDVVDANMQHYKVSADNGAFLHSSAFPVLYETGVDNGESVNGDVGPSVKWDGATGATFGVIQVDATKCAHPQELARIVKDLSNLGADMLKETSAAESGEAKRLDKVSSNSTTADTANTVSRMITGAIKIIADIRGIDGKEISYPLNTDYDPTSLNYQMVTAIGDLHDRGLIDKEEAQHQLKKGELIRHDRDLEEMNKNIDSEESGLGANAE